MKIILIISAFLLAICLPVTAAPENNSKSLTITQAAQSQIGKTTGYDPAYRTLSYPDGDVPIETGVCTDVAIRALRVSRQMDLQKLIHEDMRDHFSSYPKNWGLKRPDKNIDHRRVPNIQAFFERSGYELPASTKPADYQPGDLVTCIVPPNRPHIMIVSDKKNAKEEPLVIHNIGSGAKEEDRLFEFKITGRYRVK